MAYATVEELAEFLLPDPVPAAPERLLTRASRDIDTALQCAVYDVDDEGLPTAPAVQDALREATLEHAAWRIENGEEGGISGGGAVTSATIVGVSVTAGGTGSGGTPETVDGLAAQAYNVLRLAGLFNTGPWER